MRKQLSSILVIVVCVFSMSYTATSKNKTPKESKNIIDVNQLSKIEKIKAVFEEFPKNVPSGKVPDGPICGNGDVGVVLGGNPTGLDIYISKTDIWKAKNGYPNGGVYALGKVQIKSKNVLEGSFYAEQRIVSADIQSELKDKIGGFGLDCWVAATENLLVLELESKDKSNTFSVDFKTFTPHGSRNRNDRDGDIYFSTLLFDTPDLVFKTKATMSMKVMNHPSKEFTLEAGEKATIVIGFSTNHEKDNYQKTAVNNLKKINKRYLSSLRKEHENWWNNFWSISSVNIGDEYIEKYYYASQYFLACCSRNINFPPGLWGTSLTLGESTAWAGDYHMNYNHQAPWWGCYSSNHVFLSDPYDTPILEYMEKAKSHASNILGKKGLYYPVGIGPKGFCATMYPQTNEDMLKVYGVKSDIKNKSEAEYMFCGQKSNSLFGASNMIMRYYHTYDKDYAEKIYPYLKGCADFYEDYLVFENGRYVSYNDCFNEVGIWDGANWEKGFGDINPVTTLGLSRMLFKAMIDISQFLDKDSDKIEKWNHILEHMSEIPTKRIDGNLELLHCEGGTGKGSRSAYGFGRVMMHSLVFPSGVCGVITDEVFANELRKKIERWNVGVSLHGGDVNWDHLGNGFETFFTSAARLGYNPEHLLVKLKERITKQSFSNLWIYQHGGGIETLSGVPSCINEMLLQGYEGVVRLFPTWPKNKDSSFKNLRTHGAFVISATYKGGIVNDVKIVSEKGRDCKIENPWFAENKKCLVKRNGEYEIFKDEFFTLKTEVGEKILLMPF